LSNAVQMEAIREATEKDLTRLKKIELAGKVKSSFFNYRLFCKKRDSLSYLLARLKLHLGKVENLFREELVKKSDLLETQSQVDETGVSLEDLEQLIRSEALNFRDLCGYEPQDIEGDPTESGAGFPQAWDFFLAGHPLLQSLDERTRIVQLQKKSISASYLPQVNGFAELHYGRPGQNFFKDKWTFYFQGGSASPCRFSTGTRPAATRTWRHLGGANCKTSAPTSSAKAKRACASCTCTKKLGKKACLA